MMIKEIFEQFNKIFYKRRKSAYPPLTTCVECGNEVDGCLYYENNRYDRLLCNECSDEFENHQPDKCYEKV